MNNKQEDEQVRIDIQKQQDDKISEFGQTVIENGISGSDKNGENDENDAHHGKRIYVLSVIGEIEGHECSPQHMKTTKYEHVLPQLAQVEADDSIGGLLLLLNTMGGDVESGLAIAEMVASISKPTVSLVLGGAHSIAVPLAVSTDYSFIVPSATMLVHPVRMSGMIIGAPQTYDYFRRIQDRITGFVERHSSVTQKRMEEMMLNAGELTKDLGTILVGEDAVCEGMIDCVGGISEAIGKLRSMMEEANCTKKK